MSGLESNSNGRGQGRNKLKYFWGCQVKIDRYYLRLGKLEIFFVLYVVGDSSSSSIGKNLAMISGAMKQIIPMIDFSPESGKNFMAKMKIPQANTRQKNPNMNIRIVHKMSRVFSSISKKCLEKSKSKTTVRLSLKICMIFFLRNSMNLFVVNN